MKKEMERRNENLGESTHYNSKLSEQISPEKNSSLIMDFEFVDHIQKEEEENIPPYKHNISLFQCGKCHKHLIDSIQISTFSPQQVLTIHTHTYIHFTHLQTHTLLNTKFTKHTHFTVFSTITNHRLIA